MTSCAPVLALRKPTIQPSTAPPAKAPSTQTMTWMTGGRLTPKPKPGGEDGPADELALAADVEQAGAERDRDRQARQDQRGALTAVSDSGLKTALTVPSCSATDIDRWWNSAATVCGLKMAPSKRAT